MKIVKRIGVFETNSSSTHTLTLVSKQDYEADKSAAKPKYRKYGILKSKADKLLMACGCCQEIFDTEEIIDRNASWDDASPDEIERKKDYEEIKQALANGMGDYCVMSDYLISYELAVSLIVRVYCQLTNKDYGKTYDKILHNKFKRYLHMKFFDEGALDDARWDYLLISQMFRGDESEVLNNISRYFDDGNLLLYREYYGGVRWDDDDDE